MKRINPFVLMIFFLGFCQSAIAGDEYFSASDKAISLENSEPKKWEGYLEFMGKPGTARSLGQMDMFVPLAQDKNDMTFLNLRGQMDFGNDGSEYNIGIGHRHMFDKWIVGAYGYFDNRYSEETGQNYKQATLGMEALSEQFDFRVNGYIPENKKWEDTNYSFTNSKVKTVQDNLNVIHTQTDNFTHEKSLHGFDGEIGYKLPLPDFYNLFQDTRLYIGGYHFIGNDGFDSVSGPRIRFEARVHDMPYLGIGSRLMMGLETQWDDPRGSQTFGLVSLRIPFGIVSKKPKITLTGLDRRMMEPVVRDIDIVTSQKTFTTIETEKAPVLNTAGDSYTNIHRFDSSKTSDEVISATEEFIKEGEVPLIIIEKSIDGDEFDISETPFSGNATYTMAGELLKVDYKLPDNTGFVTSSFTPSGEAPKINFTAPKIVMGIKLDFYGKPKLNAKGEEISWRIEKPAMSLMDGTHLNGFTVDAKEYTFGISMVTPGTAYISNSTVMNSGSFDKVKDEFRGDGRGFNAYGEGVTLYVSDSVSKNNTEDGFRVNGKALMVLDNIVSTGNRGGIFVGGDGDPPNTPAKLILSNSFLVGNKEGLNVHNGYGDITINNTFIFNNYEEGLDIGAGSGIISFTGGAIYGNNFGPTQDGSPGNAGVSLVGGTANFKDTIIRDNKGGFFVESDSGWEGGDPPARVILDNVTMAGNGSNGILSRGDSIVTVTNSSLEGNCLKLVDFASIQIEVDDKKKWVHTNNGTVFGKIIVDGVDIDSGVCP